MRMTSENRISKNGKIKLHKVNQQTSAKKTDHFIHFMFEVRIIMHQFQCLSFDGFTLQMCSGYENGMCIEYSRQRKTADENSSLLLSKHVKKKNEIIRKDRSHRGL